MDNSTKLQALYCAAVFVLLIFAAVGDLAFKDEIVEEEHYCKMVALWNSDKHLPPEERSGWPPYKGECHGSE